MFESEWTFNIAAMSLIYMGDPARAPGSSGEYSGDGRAGGQCRYPGVAFAIPGGVLIDSG
jgi:hypothetical protein